MQQTSCGNLFLCSANTGGQFTILQKVILTIGQTGHSEHFFICEDTEVNETCWVFG